MLWWEGSGSMFLIDNLRIGGEAGAGTGSREYSPTVAVVVTAVPSQNSTQ